MNVRISPVWWPALAVSSPVTVPLLLVRNRRFRETEARAAALNRKRIDGAASLDLPPLDFLELDALVEWRAEEGFLGESGVSYLLRTDRGAVLFDVGYGPTSSVLEHNAARLGFDMDQADALVISHLHLDHIGGLAAQLSRTVHLPAALVPSNPKPCFLPDVAKAVGFEPQVVGGPQMLSAGIASTGPLMRGLFILGSVEEQVLLALVKGRGLVVLTGCGHPGVGVILDMVRQLSDEPLYVLVGGLHFPVKNGRDARAGIDLQTLLGTGKPPWRRITDRDLSQAVAAINAAGPQRVLLSGHDSDDHALLRMQSELDAETEVLRAGATYRF